MKIIEQSAKSIHKIRKGKIFVLLTSILTATLTRYLRDDLIALV